MARFNTINNFLAGEWSPKAHGRVNVEGYDQACEKIQNCIVHPQGGASKRPGTEFILDVHEYLEVGMAADFPSVTLDDPVDEYTKMRVFPFVFSKEDAYAVVIIQNDDADQVIILVVDTSPITTYDVVQAIAVDVVFDNVGDLNEIQFTQSGDVLLFVHPDLKSTVLYREEDGDFVLGLVADPDDDTLARFYQSYPFEMNTDTALFIDSSATAVGATTLTASGFGGGGAGPFDTSMNGNQLVTIRDGTSHGYVLITNVTSATVADGTILNTIPAAAVVGAGTNNWGFAQWSDYYGWPRTATFFEQRLIFGGNASYPDTVWGSQVGNIFIFNADYASGLSANLKPFSFTIASGEANLIQWLSPAKVLNIGTFGREYIAQGSDSSDILGAENVSFSPETVNGSAYIQAIRVQSSPVFVQRSGQKLREFVFNFSEDNYRAEDISLMGEHLFKAGANLIGATYTNKVSIMAWQEADNQVIWILDTNGFLFGATRSRDLQITAFHRHFLGGNLDGEEVVTTSICVIPSDSGSNDDLWLIAKRTIDSEENFYLEKMGKECALDTLEPDSPYMEHYHVYMDSCVLVRNSPADTTVSGLDHLEGEEVGVVADGHWEGFFTVASGAIELAVASSDILVGLTYRSLLKPLDLEAGSQVGVSAGARKRIDRATIRFSRTIGAKFGKSDDPLDLEEIEFRPADLPMNDPTPLFSGDKEVDFSASYEKKAEIVVIQDIGMPMTVTGIFARGVTHES